MTKTKIVLCVIPDDLPWREVYRSMRRRVLLAGLGASNIGLIAGCLGDTASNPGDDGDTSTGFECETGDANQPIEIDEFPATDEPPHTIIPEDQIDTDEGTMAGDDWNAEYLGECMDTEPTVEFEHQRRGAGIANEASLWNALTDDKRQSFYWAQVARSEADADEIWDKLPEEISGIDFDESVVILLQHGLYSGSLRTEWVRVEEKYDGLHFFGYQRDPWIHDADESSHPTIILADVPGSDVEQITLSLTRNRNQRLHFGPEDGIVDASQFTE